jgi:hypothetical protein
MDGRERSAQNFWFKESVMRKFQRFDGNDYEWPKSLSGAAKDFGKRGKKSGEEEKQTQEEMIRDLQGIFCTGRYRSWAASQVKRHR